MYNTKAARAQVNNESLRLPAGIQDNCKLSAIKVDRSPAGNTFIMFTFEKEGAIFTHTEWEPTKASYEDDAKFQNRQNRQLGRILQILSCYYKDTDLQINVDTFDELADWIKDKLEDILDNDEKNVLVRVKIVFKGKWKQFPDYCKYRFIEPMTTEPSHIHKMDFDIFEQPVDTITPDREKKVDDLNSKSTTATIGGEDASDVPF
jgi:hypothetical protein